MVKQMKLRIISKPQEGTRVVFIPEKNVIPVIQGEIPLDQGGVTMQYGKCGTPLANKVKPNQVRNIVIKCPTCGSYNEIE